MSARWISLNVARVRSRRSCSSSTEPRSRQRSRGEQQLLDPVEGLGHAVPLVAGVDGQAEDPDGVLLARPEEGRRHREVLVDARQLHRLSKHVAAARRGRLELLARRRRSGSRSPPGRADVGFVEAREACGAQRDEQRGRLLAVRVVGRVEDLLRGRSGGSSRAGRSGSRRTCRRRRRVRPAKRSASSARSAMPPCAMMSCEPS